MQITSKVQKYLWIVTIIIIVSYLIVSWFWKTVSFEEELMLSDGRVVVIKRWEHLKRSCEGFRCGWALNSSEIKLPSSIKLGVPNWKNESLIPLLLDIDRNGTPFVVTTIIYSHDVRIRDGLPYLQFAFDQEQWRVVSIQKELHGRTVNLLISPDEVEKERVTISEKTERNNSLKLAPFMKKIDLVPGSTK